jgi:hypothetical protein
MLRTSLIRYFEELKVSESVQVQVQPGAQTSCLPQRRDHEAAGKLLALPAYTFA